MNFYTAKENWVTKNAFKKWHALRDFMFKESGLTKKERGRYSKEIRPAFDLLHRVTADDLKPQESVLKFDPVAETWSYETQNVTAGEWEQSQIVIETNPDEDPTVDETDKFNLHITGPHLGTEQAWDSVGMISSYMTDRAHPTAEPQDPVDFKENPLALLRGRSESTKEVVEIAKLQSLIGPPYDTDPEGCMMQPVLAAALNTTSANVGIHTAYGVRVPAGLIRVEADATCELKIVVRRIEMARVN